LMQARVGQTTQHTDAFFFRIRDQGALFHRQLAGVVYRVTGNDGHFVAILLKAAAEFDMPCSTRVRMGHEYLMDQQKMDRLLVQRALHNELHGLLTSFATTEGNCDCGLVYVLWAMSESYNGNLQVVTPTCIRGICGAYRRTRKNALGVLGGIPSSKPLGLNGI